MELTGKLKEQVDKTETKEEAKQTIEEAGMILDDAELDQVSGGTGWFEKYSGPPMQNEEGWRLPIEK